MNTVPFDGSALAFLGQWEIALIGGVIVLLFFGRRVPQMMRSLGQGVTQFKKGMKEGAQSDAPAKELPSPADEKKDDDSSQKAATTDDSKGPAA